MLVSRRSCWCSLSHWTRTSTQIRNSDYLLTLIYSMLVQDLLSWPYTLYFSQFQMNLRKIFLVGGHVNPLLSKILQLKNQRNQVNSGCIQWSTAAVLRTIVVVGDPSIHPVKGGWGNLSDVFSFSPLAEGKNVIVYGQPNSKVLSQTQLSNSTHSIILN